MALRLNTSEKSEIVDIRRFCFAFWDLPSSGVACGVRGAPLWSVVACGCGVRRRVAAAKASARQGQRGHEPGRLLSLAATLMLLARRSTEDPPERREAVQRPHAGLLLWAPHH